MATYRPCLHCHRKKSCAVLSGKRKALRGLGLTLVNFKCDLAQEDFRPGERVRTTLDSYSIQQVYEPAPDDPGTDIVATKIVADGTVLWWRDRKVLVQWDIEIGTYSDTGKYLRILFVYPDRLSKLDEPPRRLCDCGFPMTGEDECDLPNGFTCRADLDDDRVPHSVGRAVQDNRVLFDDGDDF